MKFKPLIQLGIPAYISQFMRWGMFFALIVTVSCAVIAEKLVYERELSTVDVVMQRVESIAESKAQMVRFWFDGSSQTASHIVGSDSIKLFASEASKESYEKSSISEPILRQKPFIETLLRDFAKEDYLENVSILSTTGELLAGDNYKVPDYLYEVFSNTVESKLPNVSMPTPTDNGLIMNLFIPIQSVSGDEVVAVLAVEKSVEDVLTLLIQPSINYSEGEFSNLVWKNPASDELVALNQNGFTVLPGLTNEVLIRSAEDKLAIPSLTGEGKAFIGLQPVGMPNMFIMQEFAVEGVNGKMADYTRSMYTTVGLVGLMAFVIILLAGGAVLNRSRRQRIRMQEQVMHTLVRMVEMRDPHLGGHHHRVARLALKVGQEMKLSVKDRSTLFYAAQLAGVGKVFLPEEVLTKPGKLTAKERKTLEGHVAYAIEVFKGVDFDLPVSTSIEQMHERLDGSGYPASLHGDDVATLPRILGACDTFCAMIAPRSYRTAKSPEDVLEIMWKESVKYDAKVLKSLELIVKKQGAKAYMPEDFNAKQIKK